MLILFVDDDPDDYELFCEALQSFNSKAKCLHALDGEDALDTLNELIILPDYIFLDINMPKMDGRECLRQIKSDSKLKEIPVIVYSTTKQPKEIKTFKDLGAKEFIIKPAEFSELVHTLKDVIR
jgi:CheY-like chemotaxis protein